MARIFLVLAAAMLAIGCEKKQEAAGGAALAVAAGGGAPEQGGTGALEEYKLKSMATEAVASVRAMATGAKTYFSEDHVGPDGQLLKPGFPPSAPLTPPLGTCCERKEKTCAPDPKLWEAATWKALYFEVRDPFRYSYEFVSSEKGFTARAVGDLDCDGKTGTYEIQGTVGSSGDLALGPLTKQNELE